MNKKEFIQKYMIEHSSIFGGITSAEELWEELTEAGYGTPTGGTYIDGVLTPPKGWEVSKEMDSKQWDTLTKAGYGEEPKITGQFVTSFSEIVVPTSEDELIAYGEPGAYGTKPKWKDDGKHLNKDIRFWENILGIFLNTPTQTNTTGVREITCDMITVTYPRALAGLVSVLCFKANDPVGYRKMHGGL